VARPGIKKSSMGKESGKTHLEEQSFSHGTLDKSTAQGGQVRAA